MITFIGFLLLLASAALYVLRGYNKKAGLRNVEITQYNLTVDRYDQRKLMPVYDQLPFLDKPWIVTAIGVALILSTGLFFWNPSGTATAVQYPWGGDKMITTQGPKLKFWGNTIPLAYETSIKDVILKPKKGESDEDYTERRKTILAETVDGIYNRQASQREFSDAIKADIATSVIIGVSIDDEEKFLDMADRSRSEGKLIYGRVMPNIDAALKNTAKLMDAQEYISGKASDFDRYFKDQLQNGMYLVEEYTYEEVIPEIIGDSTTVRTVGVTNDNINKQSKWRIKRDAQGNIMRDKTSNTLTQYGITVHQAQVTGIDWEPSFDRRLDLQKDQVAQTQLEKQEAEKEYYRAKKEVAKAESNKARRRGELELQQVEETIQAETQSKVAEQMVTAERNKLEAANIASKRAKVEADAEAFKNRSLVNAGLTPQERAKFELEKAIGVAKQLKDLKLPTYYMSGGGDSKKDSDPLASIMQLLLAQQLKSDIK